METWDMWWGPGAHVMGGGEATDFFSPPIVRPSLSILVITYVE